LLRMESEMLEAYQGEISDKPESLKARHAVWYEQIVIPTILAHATDSRQRLVVNITNNGVLPFLSDDMVVEVPCQVGRNGCIPDTYDNSLPREVVAHLQANGAYEMLWAEAVVEKSSEKALRAALVNPLITSYDQAKGILDTIWTPYIANSATNLAHI
jgi:alpha-galactosidase/6-phospho-beta-glucosidase family protein